MSVATLDSTAMSQEVLTVVNPANEAVLDEVPCATRAQFVSSVEQAQLAFQLWRRDEAARRAALRRCGAILRKRTNSFELANLLTKEQGKPKREALNEVYAASHWFASIADLQIPNEICNTESGTAEIRREPLGIVGAITAWNYPIFLAACKMASALLPGNVVLIKPSPYTPLSTIRLVEMLMQSGPAGCSPLPKGAVTVLPGDRDVGTWFVESPEIAHVSFTGSVQVGKQIQAKAVHVLKSVTLELGGNDAAIVLTDADIETMMQPLFWGAFTNAGQFCTGIKRLYVQEPLYEQVVAGFTRLARDTVVDDGLKPKTQMGPLTHRQHFNRVVEIVERARQRGASIQTGGEPVAGPGFFYPPTIITDVSETDPVVAEEQFGPVLPILRFRKVDDAIERANSTNFGLGGSIWTRDEKLASQIAGNLECGTVWINKHGALDPFVPFGGRKSSGIGCENGRAGVSELTQLKAVYAS